MHKTFCQGSWPGRIPSARLPQLTTTLYCLPGHKTGECVHAGIPARSAPGHSGLGRHTLHKTAETNTGVLSHKSSKLFEKTINLHYPVNPEGGAVG